MFFLKKRLELPNIREISEEMANMLFRLLDKNPNTRINIEYFSNIRIKTQK